MPEYQAFCFSTYQFDLLYVTEKHADMVLTISLKVGRVAQHLLTHVFHAPLSNYITANVLT